MTLRSLPFALSLTACLGLACTGDDGSTSSSTDNVGSSETSAGGSESGESGADVGTSSDTGMDTGTDTDTGGDPVMCGEMECPAGQVCMTFPQPPACTPKPEDAPCPDGTTETQCGGAGLPCCCEPPPPTIYECVTPTGCEGVVDCSCLTEFCGLECVGTGTEGVFICEEPPAP